MEALIGSYNHEEKICRLSVNQSENISKKQIEKICKQIISEEIQNLTLEFDDGNFIFFTNLKEKIRFVEGPKIDYADLQQKAKNDLDGKIVRLGASNNENNSNNFPLNNEETGNAFLDEKIQIQHSLFSSLDQFKKSYTNAEIYFKPFEDPGGDFYWFKDYESHSLVVVGDCTGHGIQGAMISMSVMTMLKQYFKTLPNSLENSIYEFYNQLHDLLEEDEFDAFDAELGFIFIDNESKKISYIGSGVNLIVKNSKSTVLYSSRKSKIIKKSQTLAEVSVAKGDQLFLFTDGVTDQFDQSDNRKLGAKGLIKLIERSGKITLNSFEKSFNTFRGETKPLDDQSMLILTL